MENSITADRKRTLADQRKAHGFLIVAQLMAATNIVLAKYLLTSVPMVFLLATRFILAALMIFPLHYMTKDRKIRIKHHFISLNRKDYFFILIQGLCGGVLYNFFMFSGLHYTDANVAGIIMSALPAIIALMAWLILGDKISNGKVLCIAAATLGLLVISVDKTNGDSINHALLGDFLVVFALFIDALYYILYKIHPNRLPVFLLSALINAMNGIIMLTVLMFIPFSLSRIRLEECIILVVTALSSGFFYVFFFIGSQRVSSSMASITTAVMPIATALFAWLILNEDLTFLECTGMGLVIISIVFYARQ